MTEFFLKLSIPGITFNRDVNTEELAKEYARTLSRLGYDVTLNQRLTPWKSQAVPFND